MLYFLKPCGVLYRGLQRLSACVPYLEGESIVSDEKKEKNLTEHTQENQPVQHSDADIEQILNEVRQKQNYEPKTQHADVSQEDAGQASEQKKEPLEQVQNVPAQESASTQPEQPQIEKSGDAGQQPAQGKTPEFETFEDISSSSRPGAQYGDSFAQTPSQNEAKAKPRKKGKLFVLGIAGCMILLSATFFGILLLNPDVIPSIAPVTEAKGAEPAAKEAVFAKGVSIGGIDVSGKTVKEATALIVVKDKEVAPAFSVDVISNDKVLTFNQDDFSYTYNTEAVIEQAYQYSKDVAKAINEGSLDRLSLPEGENVTVDEQAGTIDFSIFCQVTSASVEKVVERAAKEIDIAAVEPHVSKFDPDAQESKRFTYAEGENGTALDREKLNEDFMILFAKGPASGELQAQTTVTEPKHTMDEVKKATVLLARFSTVSTNTYNANHNMKTAFASTNGKIVEPGGIFSFNECTGDSNLPSNGYLPASVIANGQYEQGYGGGICQAATTIYNAGIRANMGIEERYPHLWCSPYVYGGLDATIDYGNLDLKLKNNTEFQMFFRTYMDGVTLYCEIYGWQSPEFDEVRTESECTWVESEEYGFKAERVFYLNGKEVKREDLPDSVYSLSQGHYVVEGDPGNVSTKIDRSESSSKAESTKPADE